MAVVAMQTLPSIATPPTSKSRTTSDWTRRHLNQNKSIRRLKHVEATLKHSRSRRPQVATIIGSFRPLIELQWRAEKASSHRTSQFRQPHLGSRRRRQVSINHVDGIYDGDEHSKQTAAHILASGIQNPMISSETSKSSTCTNGAQLQQRQQQQQQQHLRTTMGVGREIATATTRKGAQRLLSLSPLFAVMVASIICCADLIGHCDCDTNGNNPFSGYHSAASSGYRMTPTGKKLPSSAPAQAWAIVEPTSQRLHQLNTRRSDRSDSEPSSLAAKKEHMEQLISSIERQHLGLTASKPWQASAKSSPGSKLATSDSLGVSGRRGSSSLTRHDDFLRDILASHERKSQPQAMTASGTSNHHRQPNKPLPASSKADQELRQIALMHEHAVSQSQNKHRQTSLQQTMVSGEEGAMADPLHHSWPSSSVKFLSKLPKDLMINLAPVVQGSVFKKTFRPMETSGAISKTNSAQASSNSLATPSRVVSKATSSPFSPRTNAKNHLVRPILGLGQMLITQANPSQGKRKSFSRYLSGALVAQPSSDQPKYSQPANDFNQLAESKPTKSLSYDTTSETVLKSPEQSSTESWKFPSSESGTKGSEKNGWLVSSATNLAQAYFKDSFRDLLTLSQLPIFSSNPVSTAPSDLEPGGKKWLADRKAAEQMRGNKTTSVDELLRYLYILGNVGVRRKRDPLKALSSNSGGNQHHHSLASINGNKRLLMPFRAGKPINPFTKLPPLKGITGSKLNSFLRPDKDRIKSRGVMWDVATDPTLAVTMFHLLERASVALPLGFLLMPLVHMARHNPLGGIDLNGILPARASHRSVDLEELVKRLDMVDKILSRSMRSTHRDASFMG